MTPNEDETQSWTCTVDEDGVLVIPDEAWAVLGWKEGETVEWIEQDDGSFLLVKADEPSETNATSNDAGDDRSCSEGSEEATDVD